MLIFFLYQRLNQTLKHVPGPLYINIHNGVEAKHRLWLHFCWTQYCVVMTLVVDLQ